MTEEGRAKDGIREGIRAGVGILAALKDAVEETVNEMRERGDISPDRAKDAVKSTMQRAQEAFDEAKERLDFVPRREFDELKALVEALRAHVYANHRDELHQGTNTEHYAPGMSSDSPPRPNSPSSNPSGDQ